MGGRWWASRLIGETEQPQETQGDAENCRFRIYGILNSGWKPGSFFEPFNQLPPAVRGS